MITILHLALALVARLPQSSLFDHFGKWRSLPCNAMRIIVCTALSAENNGIGDAAVAISPSVANFKEFSISAPCHPAPPFIDCPKIILTFFSGMFNVGNPEN